MEQENSDIDVADHDNEEHNQLPSKRVEIIMKSCLGVKKVEIREDTLFLVSKCTEMLIREMASRCFTEKRQEEPTASIIDYDALVNVVHHNQKFEFLTEIIPRKITFAKCKELLWKKALEESMPKKKPPKERKKKTRPTKAIENVSGRLPEVTPMNQLIQDKKPENFVSGLQEQKLERISIQEPTLSPRHSIPQKSDSVTGPSLSTLASKNTLSFMQGDMPVQVSEQLEEVVLVPESDWCSTQT